MTELKFTFDERRSTQAVAVLLEQAGGEENYTKLLKLLYLADRQSLLETGELITGSTLVAMKHGPLSSEVLHCIKGERACSYWDAHMERVGKYSLSLRNTPGDDQLSEYDVEVLTALSSKHRDDSYSRMIDIVHKLQEWKDTWPGEGRAFIPPSKVLSVGGADDATVKALAADNEYYRAVSSH